MTMPCALLLVEDEAVRTAIRFALEVEEIEVMNPAHPSDLHGALLPPGVCIVIDRGPRDGEAVGILKGLRRQGVTAPAILLTTAPGDALRAAVAAANAVLVEKPLLGDNLVAAIRAFAAASSAGEPT